MSEIGVASVKAIWNSRALPKRVILYAPETEEIVPSPALSLETLIEVVAILEKAFTLNSSILLYCVELKSNLREVNAGVAPIKSAVNPPTVVDNLETTREQKSKSVKLEVRPKNVIYCLYIIGLPIYTCKFELIVHL